MPSKTPHCDDFSVGNCLPRNDSVVGYMEGLTENVCQGYCALTANCLFYSFDYNKSLCKMYTEDYRQRCELTGGNLVLLPEELGYI